MRHHSFFWQSIIFDTYGALFVIPFFYWRLYCMYHHGRRCGWGYKVADISEWLWHCQCEGNQVMSPPSRCQMELEESVVGWGTVGLVSPGTRMLPMLLSMLTHPKPPIDCPTLEDWATGWTVPKFHPRIHQTWVRLGQVNRIRWQQCWDCWLLAVGLVMFRPSLTRHVLWRIRRGGWESPHFSSQLELPHASHCYWWRNRVWNLRDYQTTTICHWYLFGSSKTGNMSINGNQNSHCLGSLDHRCCWVFHIYSTIFYTIMDNFNIPVCDRFIAIYSRWCQ